MAELAERVARLEERFDGVATAIADLKVAVSDLDVHMRAGFAEVRGESREEFAEIRAESGREFAAMRAESRGEFAAMRPEMNTHFRWIMGGIGSATLAILFAIGAILARG